nr:hypothetical protein [Propionicimonas sp.]
MTAPELAVWAADCAERALSHVSADDPRAVAALLATRAWADGSGSAGASQDAAFEAQSAARDAQESGHAASATACRAAAHAAASVGDPALAREAARLTAEVFSLHSAPCERQPAVEAERRRQWLALPAALRPSVFGDEEPPEPGAATCAL